jgi:transposase
MKVTRILQADMNRALLPVMQQAAFLRADIWRRFGALGTVGLSSNKVRKYITALGIYSKLPLDGTIRAETTKDVVNDILSYKEAAKLKVKLAIWKHAKDDKEKQKHLFSLLKKDQWLEDPFLHRQMRKHFKHGVAHADNQFIVRSDKFNIQIVNNHLEITLHIAKKYGENIVLRTTSSGKNVNLMGSNLRIIVKLGYVEIHFATEKEESRSCGDQTIGVDKGYTEAFTDSDGDFHGIGFGKVLTHYSDKVSKTGKARNKLHALEKKHREKGNQAKADRIKKNNLGRIKLERRKEKTKKQLKTIAFKAAHSLVDKATIIAAEDLTTPIAKKKLWKTFNRRMSSWAKGILAEALESVSKQRKAHLELVNCAYTSQMDSTNGLLQGKRVGDKFHCANGNVMQADHNAARNILARLYDSDILRYTRFKKVKQILLSRSSDGTDRQLA